MHKYLSCFLFSIFFLTSLTFSQEPLLFPDGRGSKVLFPLGEISFADKVVSFKKGSPSAADEFSRMEGVLNTPDYVNISSQTYTTLGCGGEMVLKFTDNVLVDVDGPDLFIFEIGPAVEATQVYISKDGMNWIDVGLLKGGKSDIDIAGKVSKNDVFRYVKLVDQKEDCTGRYPGADLDAVGAIGSVISFTLSSAVLFDTGKFELKDTNELSELSGKLKSLNASITIEGHTDSDGSEESNQVLSEQRANSVKSFLIDQGVNKEYLTAVGYGESNPVATNETEEGKQQNRRVEITVRSGEKINYDLDAAGTWKTNNGTLHFYQLGEQLIGWYNKDDGEFYGKLTGSNKFEGRWVEKNSATKCDSEFKGSFHWGRINITFNNNFTEFNSLWNYCDQEPEKENWTGKKIE